MSNKVLFIGLDGVTFGVLEPLMESGLMPRLSRLIREGVSGPLETVFPPITPTAWSSWMTGKNPGQHGIFEFLLRQPEPGRPSDVPASSRARDGLPFWDLLGKLGRRAIVTHMPCTYPPAMVNGLMIADFLTPRGRRDFTFPASLLEKVESRFGPYQLYITEVYRPGCVNKFLDQLFQELDYKTKVNRYLMNEYEWDVFATHYWGTDRLQHELWHLFDESHPRFNRREHKMHIGRIHEYWNAVDSTFGALLDDTDHETTVYVGSDHGFGPTRNFLCINVWLMSEGWLVLKANPMTRFKRLLFRLGLTPDAAYRLAMRTSFANLRLTMDRSKLMKLANMVTLSLQDVDWSRTAAFSKGNYGQIFINLRGREAHGIVEPGAAYRRLAQEIADKLRALKDPETGTPLIGPLWQRADLYTGPRSNEAPDIQFLPRDMSNKALGMLDFTSNRFSTPVYSHFGDHRMHGMMIGRGPELRLGARVEGARIIDYAPTILHTLRAEVPSDMDGRVLEEIFTTEFLRRNPVRITRAVRKAGREMAPEMTAEEADMICKRLQALGYLG